MGSDRPGGLRRTALVGLSWTGAKNGHLALNANGHHFWLRLQEGGVQTRAPWERETELYRDLSASSLGPHRRVPSGPYDGAASGRLELQLLCANYWRFSGRQSRWGDRQSWRLEDRLPHLFREIEERVAHTRREAEDRRRVAEERAEAARRAAEARERRWHELMEEARASFAEAQRVTHLRAQAAARREADSLRRFCDAAEAAHGEDPGTATWLTWARTFIAALDPLTRPVVAPAAVEASPEALQEHLPPGWSADGPEARPPR